MPKISITKPVIGDLALNEHTKIIYVFLGRVDVDCAYNSDISKPQTVEVWWHPPRVLEHNHIIHDITAIVQKAIDEIKSPYAYDYTFRCSARPDLKFLNLCVTVDSNNIIELYREQLAKTKGYRYEGQLPRFKYYLLGGVWSRKALIDSILKDLES